MGYSILFNSVLLMLLTLLLHFLRLPLKLMPDLLGMLQRRLPLLRQRLWRTNSLRSIHLMRLARNRLLLHLLHLLLRRPLLELGLMESRLKIREKQVMQIVITKKIVCFLRSNKFVPVGRSVRPNY